jgi:hypothetical protein
MRAQNEDGTITITLMQEPCGNKVAQQLFEDAGLPDSFKAVIVIKDKQLNGCWSVDDDRAPGEVLIADENGEAGMIPQTAFKKVFPI